MRRILQTFLTGLLAALPLAATLLIFVWGARVLYEWLGPSSLFGRTLISIGLSAGSSEVAGYAIGVLIVLGAIFVLGLLVQSRLRGVMASMLDGVVKRIPVVRSVYDLVKKFVDLFSQRPGDDMQSMAAVWLRFGGEGGAAVLGLLSSPQAVAIDGRDYLAVILPTTPVPIGGALIYVPQEWVTKADVGVEALTSIYVSMGITSPQYLAAGGSAPRRDKGGEAPVR